MLLGPSGSGKTTTLRILAGLEEVDAGSVHVDGVDITDREPGERDVAMVFQSYALYPHMTVAQNIGFPLKMVGTPGRDRSRGARGGQAGRHRSPARAPARAAVGRPAAARRARARHRAESPRLFLLDEPLSNLDTKLRLPCTRRRSAKKLQRSLGVTAVYVTHDQEEAMTLADRIAVFMDGRIVQVGTPQAIFRQPATVTVAGFIGTPPMNLLPARWCWAHGSALLARRCPSSTIGSRRRPRDHAGRAARRPADRRRACPRASSFVEDLGDSVIVNLRGAGDQRLKLQDRHRHRRSGEGEHVRPRLCARRRPPVRSRQRRTHRDRRRNRL